MPAEEGGMIDEGTGMEEVRKSKDKEINKEGRAVIKTTTERGWVIVNGSKGESGEYTYVGERGSTVIDYVIANQDVMQEIEEMKVGVRIESDHMPLELKIHGTRADKKEEHAERWEERRIWDEDGIKTYHQKCENWQDGNEEVNKKWENIKNKVKEAIPLKKV